MPKQVLEGHLMLCHSIASHFIMLSRIGVAALAVVIGTAAPLWADDSPVFFQAFNLNGPALIIDDHAWQAGDADGLDCDDAAFDNQSVRLVPPTDDARAKMIRSSRWSPQGKSRIRVKNVAAGAYSLFLYIWEDNDSQSFSVRVSDRLVAADVKSGTAGAWQRFGPWIVETSDGEIVLAVDGGHANLSGLEIWKGGLTADSQPLLIVTQVPDQSATIESRVAVLLARNCLECHNASERKGGLDLTRRDKALAGGENGAAIAPRNPEGSLLLDRIEAEEMPPEGRPKLSAEERELLHRWIAAGAQWATDPIDPFLYTTDRRAGYNWWSLQAVKETKPPAVDDREWPVNALDYFVLHQLEKAGLKSSPAADRRTLIRRVSFDLIGLPPTPEEVEAFERDREPRAYERLVDRLLASPHYGERWARHWLDIVRYGESQGFERNKLRENAWKYRDFVVEAFNSDMPYDEFIRWQLAGDVLRPNDPLAVIASGFLVMGPYDLTAYNNGTAPMRAFAREEELEGLVATVGQTFMGLTINCARCHDHKFDPVTQREFYRFSAALGGIYHGDERESLSSVGRKTAEERIAELRAEAETQSPQQARLESVARLLRGGPAHLASPRQPDPWRILARGDYRQPGEVVSPGGIAAVSGVSPDWPLADNAAEAERRRALAEWIADENNPLTPRVIVNRLWGYHFGAGLVQTPSDFGFQGGAPSHRELLDWLAHELMHPEQGMPWRLKRIQRLIVTSAAYRQSSRANAKAIELDADNRLIWRRPVQRLEAEAFRDAVLEVSGDLDRKIGGPGYRDFQVTSAGNNETYTVFDAVGGQFNRRSLYRTWVRTGTSPLLDMLDCPDPSVATPQRSVTSTPLQALSLLNNAFIEHYAQRFRERLERDSPDDAAAQIRRAYALAFARAPSEEEARLAEDFVLEHGLAQFCIVLFNANEFLYVD